MKFQIDTDLELFIGSEDFALTGDKGSGVIEGPPDKVQYLREQTDGKGYLAVENDRFVFEAHNVIWDQVFTIPDNWHGGAKAGMASQGIKWTDERYVTKAIMSVQEKELFYMRKGTEVVSKPGACLTVKTMPMPPRIQKNIEKALKGESTIWDRFMRCF